ncbi:MAG: SDR family oxidoreductase [Opitutales bacterium]|nr:SDR family oxidoreductase [Opitutales bacterium]
MENYNPFSLKGKTVLVTGASSGIGKATAIECSKSGANVIITARNKERLDETLAQLDVSEGQTHKSVIADLTITEELNKVVEVSQSLDGVVLCSGVGRSLPFQFANREQFDSIFEVNFFSSVELLRLLYKNKNLKKEASVVALSSIGGNRRYTVGNSIYGATKSALKSVMKFCAREFAPRKVRVNSICPGMVETPLIHGGKLTNEQLQKDMESYPLKRYGQPEDIAYCAVYLLSDAASWVTGTSITIDGGATL